MIQILAFLVLTCVLVEGARSIPLDKWILEKIEADEDLLRAAVLREDGRDIRLLEDSTTYVPFFVEPSDFGSEQKNSNDSLVTAFFNQQDASLFAGGYLYRITFGNGSELYALSGGEWGGTWFSPDHSEKIEIAPRKVWAGGEGADFAYATILSGAPPRLVLFDGNGEVKEERRFDLSDPNLESKIENVENQYSSSGEPTLEMVSLAEYLREDDPSWRSVEVTSAFNFRNQHKRTEESERIEKIEKLTRDEAKGILQLFLGQQANSPSNPKVVTEVPRKSSLASGAEASQSEKKEPENKSSLPWIIAGVLLVGILFLLLKTFKAKSAS